jgi:hypothetical protein
MCIHQVLEIWESSLSGEREKYLKFVFQAQCGIFREEEISDIELLARNLKKNVHTT